ncbi:MAG: ribonuclease Z [Faecalibacterium sp.]
MLTVTLLGTAATMPLPDRALTAAVAECGGHSLLFDCGEGTQAAARRAQINLMRLDAICLTHYHGDHLFGLPGLLQTLACQGRTRPLTLFGPEGMGEVFAPIRALAGPLPYPVRPYPLDAAPVRLNDLASGWPEGTLLHPIATRHRVPSRGYRLEIPRAGRFLPQQARALKVPVDQWKCLQRGETVLLKDGRAVQPCQVLGLPRRGLSIVFSGDTAPCAALEQAACGTDLLICDATYAQPEQADQAKQYGHSTFGQSAALAARAGARRLWLAHYSPMITDPEEFRPAAQTLFPAAECGFDGKQIVLLFDEEESR